MAWYNANGQKAPDTFPVKNEEGKIIGWIFNPSNDPQWREDNGYIYDQPIPIHKTIFTKLQIRRAMRALEIEDKLNALLEASATFAADWADANEINLADPVLIEALSAGSITKEEIDAIRNYIENHSVEEE